VTGESGAPTAVTSTGGAVLADPRLSLGAARLDDLFPVGPAFRRSVQTYVVLLALAALIASFGLYQDSVASIIGAMVVAPLGGAIMALAAALVTGRIRWQAIALLQVGLGALMVVAIAWVVALILPKPLELTPSLDARTHPGLLDLGVALAAGAAGAWVTVRRTGSDALPGVAIAVSLVPPLATVGICLQLGRDADAGAALTLFLTNFIAIVVIASIVFLLCGAAPSPDEIRARRHLRNGLLIAVVGLAVISVPLAIRAAASAQTTIRTAAGAPVVRDWIGPRQLKVAAYSIENDSVTLRLTGPDQPGSPADLASALSAAFGSPVDLHLEYEPATWTDVHAAAPGH
jgi:uncharacterized hydrophobic protein (TIGR00271 family)